jgi:hypothetical protein
MFLVVGALGLASAASAAVSQDKLVLYLPFDEGSGTTAKDLSPSKLTATLGGDAAWGKGKIGGAMQTKSLGWALVKHNAALDLGNAWSIEVWANIDTLPDSYSSLVTKADTYMIHLDRDASRGNIGNNIGIEPYGWPKVEWPPTLKKALVPMKEWHHVTAVFDGKTRSVYVDGKLADSGPHTDAQAKSTADVAIAQDSRGCCNKRQMGALIDEVRIWNRALSADEVSQLFSGGLTAVDPQGKMATYWAELKTGR